MSLTPVTLKNATDTFTIQNRPSENFANTTRLRVLNHATLAREIYIYFPRPFPLGSTIESATLRLRADATNGAWGSATRTLTAARIGAPWKVGKVTWNRAPGLASQPAGTLVATSTKSGQVFDGDTFSFDVTAMMQAVADGAAWYGWKITTDEGLVRYFHSSQAARYKPALDVVWKETPRPPTTLSPSGGRSVIASKPIVRFDFTDRIGNTVMQAARIELDAYPDQFEIRGGAWDTGVILTDTPQVDLSTVTAAPNDPEPLFVNPGFETNLNGWAKISTGGNPSIARVTTPVRSGVGALSMTSAGAGDASVYTLNTPVGGEGWAPAVEGRSYTITGYVRSAATPRQAYVLVGWYTAEGFQIGGTVSGPSSLTTTTGYTARTVTATAPAGTSYMIVMARVVATILNEVHYWDDFSAAVNNWAGLAPDAEIHWRVKVQDAGGLWSDWSDPASFKRTSKGVLTITNPNSTTSTVSESTPPILWTFTGRTQQAYQIRVEDEAGTILYNSGKVTSTATSHTLPAGIIDRDTNYVLRVRVWDTIDRETMPDDKAYVEATRTFTYSRSGTSAITTFTVTDLATVSSVPGVGARLQWVRGTAPDSFEIVRDGIVIDRIDAADALVSGTTYRYDDRAASSWRSHTWEVRANVNGVVTTTNPTQTKTLQSSGVWLQDVERGIAVQLLGDDSGDWGMGESAEIYTPLGAQKPIRVTQALRGYEGSISGLLIGDTSQTLAQKEADLLSLKARPGRTYRLVVADLSLPVVIGNVSIAPTPRGEIERIVSFEFWQVGDFTFSPVL